MKFFSTQATPSLEISTLRRSFGSVLSTISNIEIKWPKNAKTINYTFVVSNLTLKRDWVRKFVYRVPHSSANPELRKRNFFASGCAILLTMREIGQVLLAHHLRNFVTCAKMRNPVNKLIAQKKGYNDLSPMQSTKLDRAKPATTPSLAFPRKVSTKRLLEAMSQSSDEVESDASSDVIPAKRSRLPLSGSGLRIL